MPGKPKFKPSIVVMEYEGGFVVEINLWQGDSGSFVSRGILNYRDRANKNAIKAANVVFGFDPVNVKLLKKDSAGRPTG